VDEAQEQEDAPESEDGTSTIALFTTTVSVGDSANPPLEHVLCKVCAITRTQDLVSFLALKDLSHAVDFGIAEQEDFHELLPTFGRVVVRKLIIISCFARAYDRFPPLDANINEVRRSLMETGDWEAFIPLPPSPAPNPGSSPSVSSPSHTEDPLSSRKGGDLVITKEASVKIRELKEFSGEPEDWGQWYTKARGDLGNNRWLHIAERPLHKPLLNEREEQISTSLFWQLRNACVNGSRGETITDFDPPEEETETEFAPGREAWQALVKKMKTRAQKQYQADYWNNKLTECIFTHKSTITMSKHVNDFNSYFTQMKKMGRKDYTPERLYSLFVDSILDNDYGTIIRDAEKRGDTLEVLQEDLRAEEQRRNKQIEKLRILKARRAAQEHPLPTPTEVKPPKGGRNRRTANEEGETEGPTDRQKKAWANLRMSIERHYWDVLTDDQKTEFKGMDDAGRQKWWTKNAVAIKKKVPKESEETSEPTPPPVESPRPSGPRKVNWKKQTVTNGRFRLVQTSTQPERVATPPSREPPRFVSPPPFAVMPTRNHGAEHSDSEEEDDVSRITMSDLLCREELDDASIECNLSWGSRLHGSWEASLSAPLLPTPAMYPGYEDSEEEEDTSDSDASMPALITHPDDDSSIESDSSWGSTPRLIPAPLRTRPHEGMSGSMSSDSEDDDDSSIESDSSWGSTLPTPASFWASPQAGRYDSMYTYSEEEDDTSDASMPPLLSRDNDDSSIESDSSGGTMPHLSHAPSTDTEDTDSEGTRNRDTDSDTEWTPIPYINPVPMPAATDMDVDDSSIKSDSSWGSMPPPPRAPPR